MIEYVVAFHLTAAICAVTPGCSVVQPGDGYASLTPTQMPNWCVKNFGVRASGAMLSFATPIRPQLLMGPGIKPCGLPRGRNDPPSPQSQLLNPKSGTMSREKNLTFVGEAS